MVTGGIRRIGVVQQVLDSGIAMAGIGTALAIKPDLPNAWREGEDPRPEMAPIAWSSKPLASLAAMAVVKFQLRRLSQGRKPNPGVSPFRALASRSTPDSTAHPQVPPLDGVHRTSRR